MAGDGVSVLRPESFGRKFCAGKPMGVNSEKSAKLHCRNPYISGTPRPELFLGGPEIFMGGTLRPEPFFGATYAVKTLYERDVRGRNPLKDNSP